jgi:hypothetical protein
MPKIILIFLLYHYFNLHCIRISYFVGAPLVGAPPTIFVGAPPTIFVGAPPTIFVGAPPYDFIPDFIYYNNNDMRYLFLHNIDSINKS